MQLGAVFPQTELGADPVVIRDYAQAVEGLGYHHLVAYEHVIGAHPDRLTHGWRMYTHQDQFHEPLVLFAYLAAVTQRLEFVTGILILPMRQTALVAKQAAELDVLSGGRLRLGVGIGRNRVEYEVMNASFHDRGRRSAEQVEVLRALWTQELVTFEGRWHTISNAGINPLPVQRPIPIWFGGGGRPGAAPDCTAGRRVVSAVPSGAGRGGVGRAPAPLCARGWTRSCGDRHRRVSNLCRRECGRVAGSRCVVAHARRVLLDGEHDGRGLTHRGRAHCRSAPMPGGIGRSVRRGILAPIITLPRCDGGGNWHPSHRRADRLGKGESVK